MSHMKKQNVISLINTEDIILTLEMSRKSVHFRGKTCTQVGSEIIW